MLRFRKEQEFLCDTFHFAFAEVYNSVFSESQDIMQQTIDRSKQIDV
jgi:transposase-like protein